MPVERPTIASCPKCRAILLRTERALIHPLGSEREELERALGPHWFEHSTTRFDGRFHRCLGRGPVAFTSIAHQANHDEPREPSETGHSVYRGPHRDLRISNFARRSLLIASFVAALSTLANAQQGPDVRSPRPSVAAESAADVTGVLEHLSTLPSEEPRHQLDPGVHLTRGSAYASPPIPVGSWRGKELAHGRYQIFDTLRQAAAGVVYLAHDRNLDADVVVEVPALPPAESLASKARFLRAARAGARLVHPHLVRVTEVGTHDDAPYVVSEHRSGGSLKFRRPVGLDGRPAPVAPRSLEQWLPDVADALDFLHARNRFAHDVSLANILFDEEGHASLGGFAMAEAITAWLGPASGTSTPVVQGGLTGSPPVLAPEIVAGEPADGRADQYALAATVYELLSGHSPFQEQSLAGVLARESSIEPPELRQVCSTISQALSQAVHRGLSQDPRHRFPDCKAFAQAVLLAARQPSPLLKQAANSGVVARSEPSDSRRTSAGLRLIRLPESVRGLDLALGLACGALIVVLGTSAKRRRTIRTTTTPPKRSGMIADRPRPVALSVTHSVLRDLEKTHEDADTSPQRSTVPGHRGLDVRRDPKQLPGRPHLNPVPALLPAQSHGRELVRLPDLDPSRDRPQTRIADNLLPVIATPLTETPSLPQPLGKPPLTPARRRAS